MKNKLLYAILLSFALVAVAAAPAFAQGGSGMPDKTAREERMAALHEARNESMRMFHENRTAAFMEYHVAFNETKASFLENKTRVKAECAALRNETAAAKDAMKAENETMDANHTDKNMTAGDHEGATGNKTSKDERKLVAGEHCVRDGMKPLIDQAHAEHKAQKDTLRESLHKAREDAKSHFHAKRDRAGPRSG